LIRYGIDFVIIEQREGVTAKALGVHARTLEIYEQLGLAQQQWNRDDRPKSADAQKWRVRAELDLSNLGIGLTAYPCAVLGAKQNEQLLDDYLKQNGKTVHWQTELVSFSQTDEQVTAQVKADGLSKQIEAKYLVGCDGPKSPVRHVLGLEFEVPSSASLPTPKLIGNLRCAGLFIQGFAAGVLSAQGENRYRIVGTFPKNFPKTKAKRCMPKSNSAFRQKQNLNSTFMMSNGFQLTKFIPPRQSILSGDAFLPGCRACSRSARKG